MIDMSAVIVPKSDQINADDLIAGPMTITISDVRIVGGQEQPVAISFVGSQKVYRPCKSMSRVLVAAWGADAKNYVGRSLTLYRDPKVKWGGMEVGGIRISHMSHIDRDLTVMLTMTKQNRAPHRVTAMAEKAEARRPAVIDGDPIAAARKAASGGTDAFTDWWNGPGKDHRAAVRPIMGELKYIAQKADEGLTDNPFGLPPLDRPTPEQIAAAEAEALAAINNADEQHSA